MENLQKFPSLVENIGEDEMLEKLHIVLVSYLVLTKFDCLRSFSLGATEVQR